MIYFKPVFDFAGNGKLFILAKIKQPAEKNK